MKHIKKILSLILCLSLFCPAFSVASESSTSKEATVQMDAVRELPVGKNVLSDKIPLYVDYIPAGKTYVERTTLPTNVNLTDGNTSSEWLDSKLTFADYNGGDPVVYSNGEAQCLITFFLDKVTDIYKMCVINHPNKPLMTGKYEIYAAKDLRTLYLKNSRVAHIENLEALDRQLIKCDIKDACFIGIKVIYPCQPGSTDSVLELTEKKNNHYPRFCEFAVYGSEGETATYPATTNTCDKTVVSEISPVTEEIDITTNFLYGNTSTEAYYGSSDGEKKIYTNDNKFLTDGVTNITASSSEDYRVSAVKFAKRDENDIVTTIGSENHYVDIRIDAGSVEELGMFYIKSHATQALRLMHYKIFASANVDDRTSASSLIAECYNNNGSQDQYFMVPDNNTIKARYFTIRVYDPCFDYSSNLFLKTEQDGTSLTNAYIRLLEVAAYTPDTISAVLKLDGFTKVDTNNYGYIKPGTKVKSVHNAFSGRGDVRVVDANGNLKSPSKVLEWGDKVIADADYGKDEEAGFKFCGDLDGNNRFSLSDVLKIGDYIVKGTADTARADVDASGKVTVSDMLLLSEIILGTQEGIEDNSPDPAHGPKNGVATDGKYEISVDMGTTLNDNFRGFGINSFTSILTKDGMGLGLNDLGKWNGEGYKGYNRVYHELTAERLAALKPSISRVWFQVDWIVTDTLGDKYKNYETNWQLNPDYINYKKGIYDFDNEEMQAFYEYVEMLAGYGCTIEINFGWKTATRIKDWFNTPCDDYMVGAPQDLPAFGQAAAALIKHLNEVKGYDFVEAITFYNEPNLEGDFEVGAVNSNTEKEYWSQLVHAVDTALKENGMRNKVEIWGPEVSGMKNDSTKEWVQYQLDNTASCVDQWTGHNYYHHYNGQNNYSASFDTMLYYAEKTNKNMMITEMYGAVSNKIYKDWYNWNDSFTGYYISVSNVGLNGLLAWSVVGGYLPNPLYMELNTDTKSAWKIPRTEETAAEVQGIFYEESLFTNYIPDGSKVLFTGWLGRDIKAAAYKLPDGNVTVVVENNGINEGAVLGKGSGAQKNITITFSDGIDRTFNRISYIADSQEINANATVNRPDKTLTTSGGKLTDTLGEHYSVHIYTTASPIKQVEMDYVIRHTTPKRSIPINGTMLDCDEDDELLYTISQYTGSEPRTLQNGYYKPASTAKAGDMVAVRASLKSDPNVFGVSIIYID